MNPIRHIIVTCANKIDELLKYTEKEKMKGYNRNIFLATSFLDFYLTQISVSELAEYRENIKKVNLL